MSLDAWRRQPLLWSIPLGIFLLNFLIFAFYRSAYAGNIDDLEANYEIAKQDLEDLGAQKKELQTFLDIARHGGDGVEMLYLDIFSTEAERFTRTVTEIKSLARNAGLNPTAFNYPSEELEQGLLKRSFQFSVEGTYDQLRSFISFLELTEDFLLLESVSLSKSGEGRNPVLGIRLSLSTIFMSNTTARRIAEAST